MMARSDLISKSRLRCSMFYRDLTYRLTWCNWLWSTTELFIKIQLSIRGTGWLYFLKTISFLPTGTALGFDFSIVCSQTVPFIERGDRWLPKFNYNCPISLNPTSSYSPAFSDLRVDLGPDMMIWVGEASRLTPVQSWPPESYLQSRGSLMISHRPTMPNPFYFTSECKAGWSISRQITNSLKFKVSFLNLKFLGFQIFNCEERNLEFLAEKLESVHTQYLGSVDPKFICRKWNFYCDVG